MKYRSRDISVFVMYYIYVTSGPSLLTEYYRLCDTCLSTVAKQPKFNGQFPCHEMGLVIVGVNCILNSCILSISF